MYCACFLLLLLERFIELVRRCVVKKKCTCIKRASPHGEDGNDAFLAAMEILSSSIKFSLQTAKTENDEEIYIQLTSNILYCSNL